MMNAVAVSVVALAVVLAVAGIPAEAGEADTRAVAEGNTAFALDLYAKLREGEGNLFFSPFSISTALGMTYAGARGETAAEMAKVLHFGLGQDALHPALGGLARELMAGGADRGYELHVANALWGQKGFGFLQDYLDLTQKHYGAGLREVDFRTAAEAARQTINRWVEDQTREKIKDLIPEGVLNALTRLVLTNAIYFKGTWVSEFDPKRTREEPFTTAGGQKVKAPMMHRKANYRFLQNQDFQALELPYKGKAVSMVMFLPRKADGLPAFERSLTAAGLSGWLSQLRTKEVVVAVPKFKMTCEFSLADTLKAMGMPTAFSSRADLSGMNGRRDLFIQAVLHKAFVDVNEEGTEAAAATGVVVGLTAIREPLIFRADHPFLFLIRHKPTGSILFMGRVVNPKD